MRSRWSHRHQRWQGISPRSFTVHPVAPGQVDLPMEIPGAAGVTGEPFPRRVGVPILVISVHGGGAAGERLPDSICSRRGNWLRAEALYRPKRWGTTRVDHANAAGAATDFKSRSLAFLPAGGRSANLDHAGDRRGEDTSPQT